jgi:restriction endonuclease S subunit
MKRRKISCTREYLSRTGAELGKIIPRGAVLLSVNGTIGKAAIAGCELETNQQIMAIVCKEESGILPEYLYYYLLFARKTLQSMAYQTVLERLSTNTLEQILIPVAPVEVQKSWIRQLELVEDYIWKKEDLLSEVNKARSSGWILEINLMRADYTLKKLQKNISVTEIRSFRSSSPGKDWTQNAVGLCSCSYQTFRKGFIGNFIMRENRLQFMKY